MSEPPNSKPNSKSPDGKPRGANRSTKVAGKLKVLPEQPEHLPVLSAKTSTPAPLYKPQKDHAESNGITGDSDDGDVEENDEDQEYDVEVNRMENLDAFFFVLLTFFRSTTKFHLFPRVQHAGMR
jgi:hypothetical protein